MAQLIPRISLGWLIGLCCLFGLVGCSSSSTDQADDELAELEAAIDEASGPVIDSDGFTRTVGGYYLEDNNGVFQICFRLLEQEGEVLCVDGRANFSTDDYVELDTQGVELLEDAGITRSTGQVWLWRKTQEGDGGLLFRVRPVADGEVLP